MSRLSLVLVGIALLGLSAIISFSVVTLLDTPGAQASSNDDGQDTQDGNQTWFVSNLQDAEDKTGYPIASPATMPTSFEKSESIVISKTTSKYSDNATVQQSWRVSDDSLAMIMLRQSPRLKGLLDSEPTTINGISGQRTLRSPGVDRPRPLLSLYWRENEVGYVLMGTLGGEITEEVMLSIAASVSLPDDSK